MAKSPYLFKCPVCNADVGSLCRAVKAEIVGAINVGDLLTNQVHSGRYLLTINPALGVKQEFAIGDLK